MFKLIMSDYKLLSLVCVFALGVFQGCGSGNDPLSLLASSQTLPTVELPLVPISVNAYSSAAPYLTLNSGVSTTLMAPVSGVVVQVEQENSAFLVSLLHSSRLLVKVGGLATAPRVGDYYSAQQSMGMTQISTVKLQLWLDSVAICPVSLLSTAARQSLTSALGLTAVCGS